MKFAMKYFILLNLILLSFSCVSNSQGQNCAEFKELVKTTYNFKPSKLNAQEQTAKSAQMDLIWNKVKSNQKQLLPCLREAINSPDADQFFKFDASNLLTKFDRSDEAKKILIKSYTDVDFDDIDLQYWMPYIARLGFEGFDVSSAGEKWLKYPNAHYSMPQHGTLEVDKENGALIIYGSMDENLALPALIKIASNENDAARRIAVEILMKQATDESLTELKKLNQKNFAEPTKKKLNDFLSNPKILTAREGLPKVTRQQYLDAFQQLVDGNPRPFTDLTINVPDGEKDAAAVLKKEDIPLVRRVRRFYASTANPHSVEWYQSFTDILETLLRKP